MASVASQLIQEVTAHAQSDSLEDAREICADGTYFPNNLGTKLQSEKFSQLQSGKRNSNKYTSRLARAGRGRHIRRMAKQLCIAVLLVATRCHRDMNEKSATTTQSASPLPIVLQTTKNHN